MGTLENATPGTNAQRRRRAKDERKMARRKRPGWVAAAAAIAAHVPFDSRASMAALDARLDRSGMVRS